MKKLRRFFGIMSVVALFYSLPLTYNYFTKENCNIKFYLVIDFVMIFFCYFMYLLLYLFRNHDIWIFKAGE